MQSKKTMDQSGDDRVSVLSPGCASQDNFSNVKTKPWIGS
jgi:UDP-N-acetylmuramoylalanine-D-glutamate ligase